jgi:hypothetical protein
MYECFYSKLTNTRIVSIILESSLQKFAIITQITLLGQVMLAKIARTSPFQIEELRNALPAHQRRVPTVYLYHRAPRHKILSVNATQDSFDLLMTKDLFASRALCARQPQIVCKNVLDHQTLFVLASLASMGILHFVIRARFAQAILL